MSRALEARLTLVAATLAACSPLSAPTPARTSDDPASVVRPAPTLADPRVQPGAERPPPIDPVVMPDADDTPPVGATSARVGVRPSVYCNVGLGDGCGCADAAALVTQPNAFSATELAWAAKQYADIASVSVPRTTGRPPVARRQSCVYIVAGMVYCRVDLTGAHPRAKLPLTLEIEEACAPSGRCFSLRFSVGLLCQNSEGSLTAWAETTGLSALYDASDTRPRPVQGTTP